MPASIACAIGLLRSSAASAAWAGQVPPRFGSGYTTLGEWWTAGFVMSLALIAVWRVLGGAWWKLLGYW